MKPFISILTAAWLCFNLQACTQSYTCTCTGDVIINESFDYGEVDLSEAESACAIQQDAFIISDSTVNCSL